MTSNLRRTPCVGICSTTYGDLVCRGCQRFAHEIVQWNGFAADQQQLVWARLLELREGAVLNYLKIEDEPLLRARAQALNVPEVDVLNGANLGYEVLRRTGRGQDLATLGLAPLGELTEPHALFQAIERELYHRSLARYERDFRIPAQ